MLDDMPWDLMAPGHRGLRPVQCRPAWFTEGVGQHWASHPQSESCEHPPGSAHTPVLWAGSTQDTARPHRGAREAGGKARGIPGCGMKLEQLCLTLDIAKEHPQNFSGELTPETSLSQAFGP